MCSISAWCKLLCIKTVTTVLIFSHNVNAYVIQPQQTTDDRSSFTTSGYKSVAYFTNWSIYNRSYFPWDIPARNLTHMFYAFANVMQDGTVFSSAPLADVVTRWEPGNDTVDGDVDKNSYGCVQQLFQLKQKYRNLKVSLSIGGWTYSQNFSSIVLSQVAIDNFAVSAVQLMGNWGFDGIDIDWEYPTTQAEAKGYVKLLEAVRENLDRYSYSYAKNKHFILTIAAPAGPQNFMVLYLKEMDVYLDFWSLMAYDYSGSWESKSGFTANLYKSEDNPGSTPLDTDQAIEYYKAAGVSPKKMILGMPLYGRGFSGTNGPGQPFHGIPSGEWDEGIFDYKTLPSSGNSIISVENIGASYLYNSTSKVMISYDTPEITRLKAQYIRWKGLGGGMWWEVSGDRAGADSLIGSLVYHLGGIGSLEVSSNLLEFPKSVYRNIGK